MSAKVEIGFFSFTEVTDPTEHRSYNEWHQLDHLPQQFELPGVVFGQRWVSTPACTAARVFDSELLAPVHYVTCYLMSDPVLPTLEDFLAIGEMLLEMGRFHQQRRARLSGAFTLLDAHASERVLVSDDVVPFRPNLGIYVIVECFEERDELERDQHMGISDEQLRHLLEGPGVAGVWRFATMYGVDQLGWQPGNRRITVCYLDEPPLDCASSLGKLVRETWNDRPDPEFAGPFETITPWRWDWFEPSIIHPSPRSVGSRGSPSNVHPIATRQTRTP